MPPLTTAADAVALLTVRSSGHSDPEALRLVLTAITGDIAAWPAILWLADVQLAALAHLTPDVPAAVRAIAVAVA